MWFNKNAYILIDHHVLSILFKISSRLKKPAQLLPAEQGPRGGGHSNKDIEAIIGYNPDNYVDYDGSGLIFAYLDKKLDQAYYYRNAQQAGSHSYEVPRGAHPSVTKGRKAASPTN